MGLPSFTTQLNIASCINWSFLSMNLSAVTLTVFDLLVLPWIAIRRLPNKLTLVSKMIQNPTQSHKFPSVMPIPVTIIRSTKNTKNKLVNSWSPLSQDSISCASGVSGRIQDSRQCLGELYWEEAHLAHLRWYNGWLSPKPLSPTDPPSRQCQSLTNIIISDLNLFWSSIL